MSTTLLVDAVQGMKVLAGQTARERTPLTSAANHVVILDRLGELGQHLVELTNAVHNLVFLSFEELDEVTQGTSTAARLLEAVPTAMGNAANTLGTLMNSHLTSNAEQQAFPGDPVRSAVTDATEAVTDAYHGLDQSTRINADEMQDLLERLSFLVQSFRDVLRAESQAAQTACMRCRPGNPELCSRTAVRIELHVMSGAFGAAVHAQRILRKISAVHV
jgi:hypothetical protein